LQRRAGPGGLPAAHLPSGLALGARFPAGVPAAIRSAAAPVTSRPGPGNDCPVVAAVAGSPLRAPVPVPARARVRLARLAEGRGAAATGRAVVKQSGPYGGDQQLERLTKAAKTNILSISSLISERFRHRRAQPVNRGLELPRPKRFGIVATGCRAASSESPSPGSSHLCTVKITIPARSCRGQRPR